MKHCSLYQYLLNNLYSTSSFTIIIVVLVISAGLSLIGKHAAQFKEYLAKDHEVHDCITSLCSFNFHLIKLTLYTRLVAVVNMHIKYSVVVYRDSYG